MNKYYFIGLLLNGPLLAMDRIQEDSDMERQFSAVLSSGVILQPSLEHAWGKDNLFSQRFYSLNSSSSLAANVFDFETGLKLVKKRGELMDQASGGAMAAVLGLKAETIYSLLKAHHSINVTIANDNSYTQIVISGLKQDIVHAQGLCEQAGAALVVPLNVGGAFHSPFMSPAQGQFETFLRDFQFNLPSLPIIANYTAKPYKTTETSNNLTQQITYPVRWAESIFYILAQGETEFEEVGPGKVLTGLVQRIKNGQ